MSNEDTFGSQSSTVVSCGNKDKIIVSVMSCSEDEVFYYRFQNNLPRPWIECLKTLFLSCDDCRARNVNYCSHSESESQLAYFKFTNYIKDICTPYFEPDVPKQCGSIQLPDQMSSVFKACKVRADGNCFFSAVSIGLCLDPVLGKSLRRCAFVALSCDSNLNKILQSMNEEDRNAQLKLLSTHGGYQSWATSQTIFIMSYIVSRKIIVFSYKYGSNEDIFGTIYDAVHDSTNPPLYIWLCNKHFVPLFLKSKSSEPPQAKLFPEFRRRDRSEKLILEKPIQISPNREEFTPEKKRLKLGLVGPKDSINKLSHRDTKGKFVSQADHIFENVLQHLRIKVVYYADNNEKQQEFIKKCVFSTVDWSIFSVYYLDEKGLSVNAKKAICRTVYWKQSTTPGRQKFLNMLRNAGVGQDGVKTYLSACLEKFKHLSPSVLAAEINETGTHEGYLDQPDLIHDEVEFTIKSENISQEEKKSATAEDFGLKTDQDFCSDSESSNDSSTNKEENLLSNENKPNILHAAEVKSICSILNVPESVLSYEPPSNFDIVVAPGEMKKAFDFKSMQFKKSVWPKIVNDAIVKNQGVCSFNAIKSPSYCKKKVGKFCIMQGKCGGNCGIRFSVLIENSPLPEKPVICKVTSKGAFHLLQDKSTCRQIRGQEREQLQEKLKNSKAKSTFLNNLSHISGLRALHRNHLQKSENSLRKMKAEMKTIKREDKDPGKDILLLKQKYINEDKEDKVVKGYIQHVNITPENFQLNLYSAASLSFHTSQVKLGYNVCFFDASGGMIKKMSSKTPLLYILMGRNRNGVTYPIAEFIYEEGTNVDIMGCLARMRRHAFELNRNSPRLFTNVIVVDWSWSIIHGVCKGINCHELIDYIQKSWDLLNGAQWDKRHTCVFICTSHLIAACKRLFSKKLGKSAISKKILELALCAVARTQETFNLAELRDVLKIVIRTFGLNCIDPSELAKNIQILEAKKDFISVNIKSETDSEIIDLPREDNIKFPKTLCDQSPFYKLYQSVYLQETKADSSGKSAVPNIYYNLDILTSFARNKIPMYPFWASAVPRASRCSSFFRECNAAVESSFNLRKNVYAYDKNQRFPDYARESYIYHKASLKEAVDKIIVAAVKKPSTTNTLYTELKTEKWKRTKTSRKSRLFSRIVPSTENGFQPRYGFPNIGNTCYMNALFQLVLSSPCVVSILTTTDELHNLPFPSYFTGMSKTPINERAALLLKDEIDVLTKNQFPTGTQHDPAELLNAILELDEFNFLSKNLHFKLEIITKCFTCNSEYKTFDEQQILTVQPNMTTRTAIKSYSTNEIVEDFRCQMCVITKTQAMRSSSFNVLPNYLLLMTSYKTEFNGTLDRNEKVEVKKDFGKISETITLSNEQMSKTYTLHGFITHEGRNTASGHYRAYFPKQNKFVCVDDDNVTQVANFRGNIYLHLYKPCK